MRSDEHRRWIEQTGQYNIRAGNRAGAVQIGGRELGASMTLLYERRDGALHVVHAAKVIGWRPATADGLISTGYPNPRGDLYFVADIEIVDRLPPWTESVDLEILVPKDFNGIPVVVTWWDVVGAASWSSSPDRL